LINERREQNQQLISQVVAKEKKIEDKEEGRRKRSTRTKR
jgi:hypothetical protein